MPLFQNRPRQDRDGQHLFARRIRQPIQRGEGIFSAIGSLFRRGMPLIKTAFGKGSSLVKKAASTDLAKSIGNTVSSTAADLAATAASDLIAGRDLGDLKKKSSKKLTDARRQIADLIQPSETKKKKKKKSRRHQNSDSEIDDDDDDDDDDMSADDISDDNVPPPPRKKKKKKKAAVGKARRKKPRYSVFDD